MAFARAIRNRMDEGARGAGRQEPHLGRIIAAAALLVGVGAMLLWPLARKAVEHQFYQHSYDASVETWTMPLPFGFRLMRQQSVPPAPHDGFRVYRAKPID